MKTIARGLATSGPIGYLPASGTWATLVTALVLWRCLPLQGPRSVYIFCWLFLTILSFNVIKQALVTFDRFTSDPSEIVLDEVIGFLSIFALLPPVRVTPVVIGVAFVFFRVLDITKPFGIRRCEWLFGAWGVMVDDIVAALFAALLVYCGMLGGIW